jgi:hypothetical protein
MFNLADHKMLLILIDVSAKALCNVVLWTKVEFKLETTYF